jgi:hypothetical protein
LFLNLFPSVTTFSTLAWDASIKEIFYISSLIFWFWKLVWDASIHLPTIQFEEFFLPRLHLSLDMPSITHVFLPHVEILLVTTLQLGWCLPMELMALKASSSLCWLGIFQCPIGCSSSSFVYFNVL